MKSINGLQGESALKKIPTLFALLFAITLSGCTNMTLLRLNGQLVKLAQSSDADKLAALARAELRHDPVGVDCLTKARKPENAIFVPLPVGVALGIEIWRTGLISPELRAACTPWLLGVGQQRFP